MPHGIPPIQGSSRPTTSIGVFYDGNYFNHVSTYYKYSHARRARLSIAGLHRFVRAHITGETFEEDGTTASISTRPYIRRSPRDDSDAMRRCQIVDAHYFRGRLTALEAEAKNSLLNERLFEDVLMKEGVITHSLPLVRRRDQTLAEKGMDVWFALEAYELTLLKRYDVTVLVACDRDYLPLVRKLNMLGAAVMILGWDFTHTDELGVERPTVTAPDLLAEAAYPLAMHEIIEAADPNDPIINGLFVEDSGRGRESFRPSSSSVEFVEGEEQSAEFAMSDPRDNSDRGPAFTGTIQTLKEGYGFITTDQASRNLFFSYNDLLDLPFDALQVGNRVGYYLGSNFKGECATGVHKI